MQRNQGRFEVHSSWRLSPDLKTVPEGVEERMESLARTVGLNKDTIVTTEAPNMLSPH